MFANLKKIEQERPSLYKHCNLMYKELQTWKDIQQSESNLEDNRHTYRKKAIYLLSWTKTPVEFYRVKG